MSQFSIPLSRPFIPERAKTAVLEALDNCEISGTSSPVWAFEDALKTRYGRSAIAVSNATLGLQLALKGLDIKAGDEVIVPAFTFAAPVAQIVESGATPVLVDIDPVTWCLDPEAVEQAITSRTKAILAVDVVGHSADYDALRDITEFHIPIIQDAAEAHAGEYNDEELGSQGDISVFSYHASKVMSTGEGGSVLALDDALIEKMRRIANHGTSFPYHHVAIGTNYRMQGVVAAMAIEALASMDECAEARRKVIDRYRYGLRGSSLFTMRQSRSNVVLSPWLATVVTPEAGKVVGHLRAVGIDARRIWRPIHQQPAFSGLFAGLSFPISEMISDMAIMLPTYVGLQSNAIDWIVTEMKQAVAQ